MALRKADSPLERALSGSKPRSMHDYPVKRARTAHAEATPHHVPGPDDEERERGSCPWGREDYKR